MNAHAPLATQPAESVGEVITIESATALAVLTDPQRFNDFYAKVKAETDAFTPDLTTDKGRKAVASMARKVVNTKVAIVAAANELTEEWRANTAKVVASRKTIEEKLNSLRDEVRKPLTDWEDAEKARAEEAKRLVAEITNAAVVTIEDTSATVEARLNEIRGRNLDPNVFGVELSLVMQRRDATVETLSSALVRLREAEEAKERLARLEREEAERKEREAEAAAQAEAARQKTEHARQLIDHWRNFAEKAPGADVQQLEAWIRQLEALTVDKEVFGDLFDEATRARDEELARLRLAVATKERERAEAAERAAQEAADRAAQEAAERATKEAADRAAEEQRQRDAEHEAQLAAERRRADEADQARKDQEAKAERERQEREAQEKAEAEAKAKREADIEHRSVIMRAAKEAIMEHGGITEAKAKAIVLAIGAKSIPHVSIQF